MCFKLYFKNTFINEEHYLCIFPVCYAKMLLKYLYSPMLIVYYLLNTSHAERLFVFVLF